MFKIYDGKVYNIDYDKMNFDDMIAFFRAGDCMALMTRLIVIKDGQIYGALSCKDVIDHKKPANHIFTHSEHIFEDANEYANSQEHFGDDNGRYPVVDEHGNLLYILEHFPDNTYEVKNYYFKTKSGNANVRPYSLEDNRLDLQILDRADLYIFTEFNEYSYALTKVIHKHLSNREVYFLDKKACDFLSAEECIYTSMEDLSLYILHHPEYRVMYVKEDVINLNTDGLFSNTFGIIDLFDAVFWAQALKHPLDTPQKIRYAGGKQKAPTGLIAQLDRYTKLQQLAKEKHLKYQMTSEPYSMNKFTTLQKYCRLADFDFLENEDAEFDGNVYLPYIYRMILKCHFHSEELFLPETIKLLDEASKQILPKDARVLGVLVRGTDYLHIKPANHSIAASADKVLERAMRMVECDGYDYVYLATEDADIFKKFQDVFGEFLLSVDQKRYSQNAFSDEINAIADLISEETEEQKEKRLVDYLKTLYTLSKCTSLLASNYCGGTRFAVEINENQYEDVFIYQEGTYH